MRRELPVSILLTLAIACSSSNPEADGSEAPADAAVQAPVAKGAQAVAYFAGGCFWGVEFFLENIEGVYAVESGYMGGHIKNPSYAQVTGKRSGHLETVRVRYDPAKVDYETLARRFFEIHDPTQADGQGPDLGPQYRSAVFVRNDAERAEVEGLISRLKKRGYAVVTAIKPGAPFYEAEAYHQDYYLRTQKKPYCHAPVDRFGDGG
ncbi:MAG: peptide-methionine (S)-S-oxide reductase MsrA [Nannocystaceae bacterium]